MYNGSNDPTTISTDDVATFLEGFDLITAQSGERGLGHRLSKSMKPYNVGDTIEALIYIDLINENVNTTFTLRILSGISWNPAVANIAIVNSSARFSGLYKISFTVQAKPNANEYKYFYCTYNSNISKVGIVALGNKIPGFIDKYIDNVIIRDHNIMPFEPILFNGFQYAYNASYASTYIGNTLGYYIDCFNNENVVNAVSVKMNKAIPAIGANESIQMLLFIECSSAVNFSLKLSSRDAWGNNASVCHKYLTIPKSGIYIVNLEYLRKVDGDNEYNYVAIEAPGTVSNISKISFYLNDEPINLVKEIQSSIEDIESSIEDIESAIEEHYDADILFWGDSLTAGAGGNGTSYPNVCSNILNKTYKNCGVGGETANTIAARQGGNNVIIPAGNINGQYTVNQLIDIFGTSIHPLRQGNGANSGNKLYINGEECSVSISQSTSTSSDAIYTISGYTGGASSVPLLGMFAGSLFAGKVVVIWVGQNGASIEGTDNVNARMSIIDSMIKHIGHNRYIILGLSTGTDSSRNSEDSKLLAYYGNKFLPTRKLLVEQGLIIAGITPTSQDNSDIAVGTVPTSLRSDGVHLNASGYTALGTILADKIMSLGYFD